MDTNYSRWIHNDDGDHSDAVVEEPSQFRFRRPARSVVASGAMVALIALGVGGLFYSLRTPDAPTDQASTVDASTADASDGPGAAGVEDAATTAGTATDSSTTDVYVPPRPVRDHRLGAPGGPPPRMRLEVRRAPAGGPAGPHLQVQRFQERPGFDDSDSDGSDSDGDLD